MSPHPPALVPARLPPRPLGWREARARAKARFAALLRDRFFLRLHVVAILAGTVLAGTLASALALNSGVESMALRALLGLGVAYLAFLGLVRAWIAYVQGWRPEPDAADLFDACDLAGDVVSGPGRVFHAAGGEFGGGGAQGSWGDAPSAESSGGDSASFGLDLDDGILIVLFLAVVLAALGGLVYVVAIGPSVLAEAAFEVILATSLARRWGRECASGLWLEHLVRSTIVPFLTVAALTAAFVWVAQGVCPEAVRLREVVECMRR